jgi:hypothetical protein
MDIFSFPWPGPGNSDAPDDPEGWVEGEWRDEGHREAASEGLLVSAFPWPGPGNSDG